MTPASGQAPSTARVPATATAGTAVAPQYTGEVVYIYAFDIAYELLRAPIKTLLGQPVAQFAPDKSKRSPRQVFFHRAQMVRLPPMERFGPFGSVRVERTVKVLPVGAVSITVRIPFRVGSIAELVAFHDLRFSNGGVSLYDEVRELAQEVRRELAPYCVRPNPQLGDEEACARTRNWGTRRRTPSSACTRRCAPATAARSAPRIGSRPTAATSPRC
jgi:hypothetical protein